ncbi:MAG: flippase-like domain-containing protein [Thermoanaerobaculia bacterium]|nr:flippase-like domain-containing protein [Thermoanaerobaculia bacterium]
MPTRVVRGEQSASRSRRRAFLLALRALVTLAVVALVVRQVDLAEVRLVLAGADLRFLIPIVALRPFLYAVRGLRIWHILRVGTGRRLPILSVVGWHFVALNLGVLTPAGLGDFSLAYFLRRHGIDVAEGLATVLIDRLLNLVVLTLLAGVGVLLYLEGQDSVEAALWMTAIGMLLTLAISYLVLIYFQRLSEQRSWRIASAFSLARKFGTEHPGAVLLNLGGAILQTLIFTLQLWLSFRMVGATVGFGPVLWLGGLGRMINLLPVTLNGIGIYEGAMVYLFGLLDVGAATTLSAVLFPRLVSWLMAGLVLSGVMLKSSLGESDEEEVA